MTWHTINTDIKLQNPRYAKIFYTIIFIISGFFWPFFGLIYIPFFVATKLEYKILSIVVFLTITLHEYNMWVIGEYRRMSYTPYKIKWNSKGIEIINVFGKYRKIEWSWISNIDKKVKKSLLKRKAADLYQVHLQIPEGKGHNRLARHFLYYSFKHLFFVDEEIGKKLYEYWIKNIKKAGEGLNKSK